MAKMIEKFESQLNSEKNSRLLDNFRAIANAQVKNLWRIEPADDNEQEYYAESGIEQEGIIIDRSAREVLGKFGLRVSEARNFVKDGTVADLGCGKSKLLSRFRGAKTIAIDANESSLAYQKQQGHHTIQTNLVDLHGLADNSVDLAVAHMSAPYWLFAHEDGRAFAKELIRVTKVGGMALVGSIVRHDEHVYAEYVSYKAKLGEVVTPWNPDLEFHRVRHTSIVCMKEVMNSGRVELVASRIWETRGHDFVHPQHHVPNYFWARKIC